MNRVLFQAVRVEYFKDPSITISVDGVNLTGMVDYALHAQNTFRGRRITLPVATSGYIGHMISSQSFLLNYQFEATPIEAFSQQNLFHYYEVGFRGSGELRPEIYLDGVTQDTSFRIKNNSPVTISTSQHTDTVRVYFDPLAYGFIPHIHNIGTSDVDAEILWARPVQLPPRFYKGLRTHAEFQITFKGNIELEWFLDGQSIGTYTYSESSTVTKKDYFPSGTIGQVLQYVHLNPEDGGKIYMVETDQTLADLEQQAMRPQPEG